MNRFAPTIDGVPSPAAGSRTVPRASFIAAGVTVLLWASAFVGIRSTGHSFGPGSLALGRLLVATVALGIAIAIRGRGLVRPGRTDAGRVVAYAVLWFAAYNVALNGAERHLDAGTAAMLVNVGPILIALMAGRLLREGYPRPLLAGSAIALCGALVIGASAAGGRQTDLAGVGLCLLAALLYAGGVIVQKPVLARVPALQATWLGCAVGAVVCLPFLPALVDDTRHASAGAIAGVVYLGVFPTAVAFTTWAYALARTEAGRMGATTYLVPAVAALLSWVILGETPRALALAGGVLCLVGVAVTRLRPRGAGGTLRPDRSGPARSRTATLE